MGRLHYKKIPGVSYNRQGYITFLCLEYNSLSEERKQAIRKYCDTFEEYSDLLFEYAVKEYSQGYLCSKHYVSQRTLSRLIIKFYKHFPKNI